MFSCGRKKVYREKKTSEKERERNEVVIIVKASETEDWIVGIGTVVFVTWRTANRYADNDVERTNPTSVVSLGLALTVPSSTDKKGSIELTSFLCSQCFSFYPSLFYFFSSHFSRFIQNTVTIVVVVVVFDYCCWCSSFTSLYIYIYISLNEYIYLRICKYLCVCVRVYINNTFMY